MQRSVKSQALRPTQDQLSYQPPPTPQQQQGRCFLLFALWKLRWVYLLIQPCCQTPVGRKVATLGLVGLHQSCRRGGGGGGSGQLVLLSGKGLALL